MAMVLMEEEEILAIVFESMAKSLKEKEALILEGRLALALEAAVAAIISAKTRPGGGTSPEEEGSEAASLWLSTRKDDAERGVWMVLLQIKVVNALVARLSMLIGFEGEDIGGGFVFLIREGCCNQVVLHIYSL
jgi:hypothetical protein